MSIDSIKDLEFQYEELSAKHKSLGEQIQRLKAKPTGVWEPKKGEKYWYVGCDGVVQYVNFFYTGWDKRRLDYHNFYKTQGQAEKAAKHQRRYNMVSQAVLNLEPEQVVYWSDKNQAKYGVEFNHRTGVWFRLTWLIVEHGYPVLTDEKNVQPLLDYLNAKEKGE